MYRIDLHVVQYCIRVGLLSFLVTTIVEGQVCERVDVSGRVDLQQPPLQSEVRRPDSLESRRGPNPPLLFK